MLAPRCYYQIRHYRTHCHLHPPHLPHRRSQPPMGFRHTSTKALWYCASFIFAHIDHGFLSQMLERELSGQLAESTHVQAPSRFSKHPTFTGGAGHASTKPMSDINPPTLDLRALSLNRATGASKAPPRLLLYRTTTSSPPSPSPPPHIPPIKSEADEMEDLYRPSSRHESRRQRSLSLQLPAESEPRVLPVLAAEDPHVLAVLEGQELREAARPRRGMRKAQAVHGAGKRRAGFVLVEGLTAGRVEQKSRWAISRK